MTSADVLDIGNIVLEDMQEELPKMWSYIPFHMIKWWKSTRRINKLYHAHQVILDIWEETLMMDEADAEAAERRAVAAEEALRRIVDLSKRGGYQGVSEWADIARDALATKRPNLGGERT